MVTITIKDFPGMTALMAGFIRLLAAHNLIIVARREDRYKQRLELDVDARLFGEVQWLTTLAYDVFQHNLISITEATTFAPSGAQPKLRADRWQL